MRWIAYVALVHLLAAVALGATLWVPEDFPIIQTAIDAASPGDAIVLSEGIYQQGMIITKDLTIRGEGEVVVVIDEGTVADVRAGKVTLQNLTFKNGFTARHAIDLCGQAELTLLGCRITRGSGLPFATGIECSGNSRLVMLHSRIEGAVYDGVRLLESATAHIENGTFSLCGRYRLAAWTNAQVTGSQNRMEENGCDLAGNVAAGFRIPTREPKANEIHCPDPEYASLQEAVDALAPGGVLYLAEGEHEAGVVAEKPLTIRAEDVSLPVLSCPVWQTALLSLISKAELTLIGVTLKDGEYGIVAWGGAKVQVEECSFVGSPCGIYAGPSSQARISDCAFEGNVYGIFAAGDSQAALESVHMEGVSYGVMAADESVRDVTVGLLLTAGLAFPATLRVRQDLTGQGQGEEGASPILARPIWSGPLISWSPAPGSPW